MDGSWRKTKRKHFKPRKLSKERGEIVYQALGWLAREDKINYHTKERKTFVSLSHEEREIFKNASGTLSEQASQKDSQV